MATQKFNTDIDVNGEVKGTSLDINGTADISGNITCGGTVDGVDIAARDAILTSTTTTANAALPKSGGTMSGAIAMGSNNITGGGTITGTTLTGTSLDINGAADISGNLTLSGGSSIIDQGAIYIQDTAAGRIGWNRNTSSGAIHDSSYNAFQAQVHASGADGKFEIQAYTGAGGYGGSFLINVNAQPLISDYILHKGDENTKIGFSGSDTFIVHTGGTTALTVDSSQNATFAGTITTDRLSLFTSNTDRATIQAGSSGTTGHLYLNSYEGSDLHQLTWSGANNGFYPQGASGTFSLGLNGNRWSNVYTVAVTASGELEGGSLDINGNADISGALTLGTALAVAEGGTGLTSISTLLNSNVTSVSGSSGSCTGNAATATAFSTTLGLTTVSMTFQLAANTWTDTGINSSDLATGTYAMQVYVDDHSAGGGHYDEFYSATISWYGGTTNNTNHDEIVTHNAGHANNTSHLQFRTLRHTNPGDNLMLQVKQNFAHSLALNGTDGKTMTFKFRRLI